jgi:hypothetical protein
MRNGLWQSLAAITLATCMWSVPARADLNDGLIAHSSFDDGTARDVSGNGHDGTILGATPCAGVCGGGLYLDGTDDYVDYGTLGIMVHAFSIWIRPDYTITPAGPGYPLMRFMDNTFEVDLGPSTEGIDDETILLAQWDPGVQPRTAVVDRPITNDTWHMLCASWNWGADRYDIYFDGELQQVTKGSWPYHCGVLPSVNTAIGISMWGDTFFQGAIDEVRIYERALSADDVHQLYCSTCPKIGDMNCDCYVDGFDIDPFFLALGHEAEWHHQYPDCDIMNGDINRDGYFDGFDIDPFFALLQG